MMRFGGTLAAKNDLPGIQILRGIAALAVIIHHSLEESNGALHRFSPDWLTTSGAAGVDIFFVISGFIMLHVSFRTGRASLRPGQFLLRRITRIYPLYWLTCLGAVTIAAFGLLRQHHWTLADIMTSLLLVPNQTKLIGVSWTLVYEMFFYLIFAATLLLHSREATVLLSTIAILGFGFAGASLDGTLAAFLANPIALEFCMGLCLALTYSRLTRRSVTAAPALCLLGLGLIIVATLFVAHPSTNGLIGFPRVLAWGLPATMVVWGSLWIDATGTRIARFGVLIGDASYALYLTHGFVMIGYAWLLKYTSLGSTTQILVVPIVVMVAVLVGLCAHVAVERPLLRLARVTRAFRPVGVRPVAY